MKVRKLAPLLVVAVAAAYVRFGRRCVQNWGATEDEVGGALPGDELVPDAGLQTTRAVTIETAPAAIWPWLLQMGPRPRAGAYTYDWIERLLGIDIENSNRILPEFQHLGAGEFLRLDDKGTGLTVVQVEPEQALVLQWEPAGSSWAFVLQPEGENRTRLISRNRISVEGPLAWLGMVAFMEPGSLIMERKMLLGIKERAESLAAGDHGPA